MNLRKQLNLNADWQFHDGELQDPRELTMKSLSLGGLTTPVQGETGKRMTLGPSGAHFLGLVGQGNQDKGLAIVAGTDVTSELDDSWRSITVPYDWKRNRPYQNRPELMMNGFKEEGVGYYRRSFALPQMSNQRITLHFDGIMGISDIWYNGAYLKHNISGYVTIDIDVTALTRYGDEGVNTLLVKTDTTHGAEGWWYEGAGIYRDVWLEMTPLVHLIAEDSYLTTEKLTMQQAEITGVVVVQNDSDKVQSVSPQIMVANQAVTMKSQSIPAHEKLTMSQRFSLSEFTVWSPENPRIYPATFRITNDEITKNFGIKTVAYKLDGFYLNHKRYELHGVCYHQDFAGVGIAQTKDILDYKLGVLKAAGVNALRSAHHFASPDLMDACDRHGILLMNENRLLETSPWRMANLKHMVKLSRMHPALAFWSLSNEELVGNTAAGGRLNRQLATTIRQLDQEHIIVQAELLNPEGIIDEDYTSHIDVLGVNYPESMVMGSGAQEIHDKHPQLPMMCTENACSFTTRGVYKDDFEKGRFNNFGAMYSMVFPGKGKPGDPGLGGTASPKEVISYVHEHSYMGGAFIWTGFDYYGELSPLSWPSVTSSYGLADICGFEKDVYYYYQAQWITENVLHVMPSWNREAIAIADDGTTPVRVYTNADEVQIYVNQQDYGKYVVKDCTVDLTVTYVPGTLRVVSFKNGQQIGEAVQKTTGKVSRLQTKLLKEGQRENLYEIMAIDQDGNFASLVNDSVQVTAIGGQILALNNGDPFNHDDRDKHIIKLFNGKALVIMRKQEQQVQMHASLVK